MSIAEFVEERQAQKCSGQLSIKHSLSSYDYLDCAKTYNLEVCSDDSEFNDNYVWSLSNPYSNGFYEEHEQSASINNPKVILTPSEDTKSCTVTIDPSNIFRTACSITVYVWNAENSIDDCNIERDECLRQTAKISVSAIYVFKK